MILSHARTVIDSVFDDLIVIVLVSRSHSDRAGSISTLDSLDFARYSDDGNRESDERVAGKTNETPLLEKHRAKREMFKEKASSHKESPQSCHVMQN